MRQKKEHKRDITACKRDITAVTGFEDGGKGYESMNAEIQMASRSWKGKKMDYSQALALVSW